MKSVCPMWRNSEKRKLLGYEKEVLGIYLSGHPLENYRGMMEKTILRKPLIFSRMKKQIFRKSWMVRK